MAETRWWTHTRIPRHEKPIVLTDNRSVRLAIAARMLGEQCDEEMADDAIALAHEGKRAPGVYVIGAFGLGCFKVGWSGNMWSRIREISGFLPVRTIVMARRLASCQSLEATVHKALLPWHKKGEWFNLTAESILAAEGALTIKFHPEAIELVGVING